MTSMLCQPIVLELALGMCVASFAQRPELEINASAFGALACAKGRQYVTVASGLGGILATRDAARKMPTGGSIWAFALMTE